MPYIDKESRQKVEDDLQQLCDTVVLEFSDEERDGLINYIVSRLVCAAFNPNTAEWRYRDIGRAVMALECAKAEFYRRVAGPKEDRAIEANGDLYEYRNAT